MKHLITILALGSFSSFYSQISITSNIPNTFSSGSATPVDVKINKGTIGNFAKYQMDLPMGYVVTASELKGGNFTFENQRAKIVWVSMPSEAEFTVKFNIQASSNAATSGSITQKLFYLENNEKKEFEAGAITIGAEGSVAANTPATTEVVAVTPPKEEVKTQTPPPVEEVKPIDAPVKETVSEPVKTVVKEPVKETVAKTTTAPKETTAPSNTTAKTVASSTAEAGIVYKIQLGAFTSEPSKGRFVKAGKVTIELVNGLYKVTTVNNFNSREEAIKYKDQLSGKGFEGLFLVKIQNGKRIN